MRAEHSRTRSTRRAPTIVCAQAGEVNTGAFDDLEAIVELAARARRLGPRRRRVRALGRGEPAARAPRRGLRAGRLVGDRRAQVAERARTTAGSRSAPTRTTTRRRWSTPRPYLAVSEADVDARPDGLQPEFSRRARAVPVVGGDPRARPRRASPTLVERCCAHARAIAEGLAALPGCEIAQRRRAQPGALPVRGRRADAGDPRRRAERGRGVDEPDRLGRPSSRSASRSSSWRTSERDVERTVAAFARGPA